jgi:hypothetical protein
VALLAMLNEKWANLAFKKLQRLLVVSRAPRRQNRTKYRKKQCQTTSYGKMSRDLKM